MAAVASMPPAPHTATNPRPSSSNSNRKSESAGPASRRESMEPKQEKEDIKPDAEKSDHPVRPGAKPMAQARSKFDLEPNPFEQSFSQRSHHSSSSVSDRANTPPRGGDATAVKHHALPPLSSLTSPAAADPSQFPWLASQSLRTGPLSPAMLAGPQHANGGHPPGASHLRNGAEVPQEGGFDSTTFRTGFTPGTGSGFTPGYSSLMNGSSFGNLPMPSPNTAAFLNMVTNSTPLADGAEGAAQPAADTKPNVSNGHLSALPPHMQSHHGLAHINGHSSEMGQDTITPGTFSALTGVINDMNRNPSQGMPPQQAGGFYPPPIPGQPNAGVPGVDYAQQSANAASQAANGLFLLSQAHQELSKREEERGRGPGKKGSVGAQGQQPQPQAQAQTKVAPPPPTVAAGQKRKSDAGPPAKGGKKGKKTSISNEEMKKAESTSPGFSAMGDGDSDDEDGMNGSNSGKPETEEDKRKNFLERNRQAALKCRQRKKAWLNELQAKVEQLTMENERLQQTIGGLHEEVGRLTQILMRHGDPNLAAQVGYGRPIR